MLNTLRVWINGALVPAVDLSHPVSEVSDWVRPGPNEIRIEASSTLFNAVKARLRTPTTATEVPDHPEYFSKPGYARFGLVGPVVVQFLRRVVID